MIHLKLNRNSESLIIYELPDDLLLELVGTVDEMMRRMARRNGFTVNGRRP